MDRLVGLLHGSTPSLPSAYWHTSKDGSPQRSASSFLSDLLSLSHQLLTPILTHPSADLFRPSVLPAARPTHPFAFRKTNLGVDTLKRVVLVGLRPLDLVPVSYSHQNRISLPSFVVSSIPSNESPNAPFLFWLWAVWFFDLAILTSTPVQD